MQKPTPIYRRIVPYLPAIAMFVFGAVLAHAQAGGDPFSIAGTAAQNTFTNTVAPTFALITVIGAGISYKMGHPGAAIGLAGAAVCAIVLMKAQAILAWIGA